MSVDRPFVWLDWLPQEDQEKCFPCTARGADFRGQIPFPTCKVAMFQKDLGGKKPKLGQIGAKKIDISNIPLNCPNGY